ncbi:MAG: hypothetical protein K2J39_05130, partial [Ruminococcus sp.]|nr:hypothetical protein [Ruminococcus sp.]
MKQFVSILLCIIIPLFWIIPVNSNALDVQGNEYPDPSLMPIDINFSDYDYYFLTISGSTSSPSYYFYFIKDNSASSSNRLYFTVALQGASTYLRNGSFTSFGVTTDYTISRYVYSSVGSWNKSTSSTMYNQFYFDGYSTISSFTSDNKYIIGSNVNIYDYSGILVRSGDYETLCSYFKNGLSGSSDKTEKPIEPTTSGGSDTGDIVNIDLSFLHEYFNRISDLLDSLLSNIAKIIDIIGSLGNENISSYLDEIKLLISNLNSGFSYNIETSVSSLLGKLDEIKTEIVNFERYFSEFSAVNGEIANIFTVLNGLNINIININTKLMETIEAINNIKSNVSDISTNLSNFILNFRNEFEDIINSINSNVSSISTNFSNFLLRFPTDFGDIINSIKSSVSSISTNFSNFLLRFP